MQFGSFPGMGGMSGALLVLVLALGTEVEGANCKPGLFYCGSTLKGRGNYRDQMANLHYGINQPWVQEGENTLYKCVLDGKWTPYGTVKWLKQCSKGCVNGGSDRNDYCREDENDFSRMTQDSDEDGFAVQLAEEEFEGVKHMKIELEI